MAAARLPSRVNPVVQDSELAVMLVNVGVEAFAGRLAKSPRPLRRQGQLVELVGLTLPGMAG